MKPRTAGKTAEDTKNTSAMRSPVYWTLLGLVIERPNLYAYQLAKRYRRKREDVLPVSSDSHIYTALNVLQARELIDAVPSGEPGEADGDRQPRPRYRATAGGVQSYRDWLCTQVREDRRQAELFARQLAALAHKPEAALRVIGHLEQAFLGEASHARISTKEPGPVGSGLASELASEEKRLVAEAKLGWAEYARRRFEALHEHGAPRDGPAA